MTVSVENIEEFVHSVLSELATGQTTEHSYRPAFKKLFSNIEKVKSVNEPKQSKYGAPDFVFLGDRNKDLILGYAEMKDIDKNLDEIEKSNQMERYRGYKNIFLTNNLDFRFFRNGAKYFEIKIGKYDKKTGTVVELNKNNYGKLADELTAFFEQTSEPITNGKRLAEIMGGKARRIRDNIKAIFEKHSDSEIEKIYGMMKELLVTDLTEEQFADMYAQTLVYGLFTARYNDDTPDNFTRAEARDLVPPTNPFLREFFDHIAGANFNKSLSYIVDELCEIFAVSDIKTIVHKHLKLGGKGDDEKDPIIHFYEDFLANYDAELRKKMGAYYTPTPVVRYIVRMVDKILKEEFGLADGIASNKKIKYTHKVDPYQSGKTTRSKVLYEKTEDIPAVQILDPAVGTATFLNESIKYIYDQKFENQKGLWNSYVNDNILPRFNGFELMMTPYTIAHLKLGMTLSELGAKSLKTRLRVFLTNTLTEGIEKDLPLFALLGLTKVVAEESNLAAEVKNDLPVMVVMGNPPYSGESSNKTEFANSLIDKYKYEPGGKIKLNEKNPKWLNDDYVKFMSFAEDMIMKNGKGVMAMITNHGYIDNPTFRGMRWHLTKTFDKIYILDLHGNIRKKEKADDGGIDENVFDTIQQGVSIIAAVKTTKNETPARVFYSSVTGRRKKKYETLNDFAPKYKPVSLDPKMYYFCKKESRGKEEYDEGIAINELMPLNSAGILTGKDSVLVSDDESTLLKQVNCCAEDGEGYISDRIRKSTIDQSLVEDLSYRPFDYKKIYYDTSIIERPRKEVMVNLLRGNIQTNSRNICLVYNRKVDQDFSHIFVSEYIIDAHITGGLSYASPLMLSYPNKKTLIDDEKMAFPDNINISSGLLDRFLSNIREEQRNIVPEDVVYYVYASLYSPTYRKKYQEFLRMDFPRIPLPRDRKEFRRLVELGKKLCELHLMHEVPKSKVTFPIDGDNMIEKITYDNNKVYVNRTQYFDNVSEFAWNFYIGGYQPAQKWLKDRKGRELNTDDILHYEKIIAVLEETDKLMKQIG